MAEKNQTYGSGSGTNRLFVVEARLTSDVRHVRRIASNELTKEWHRVQFASSSGGVPNLPLHPLRGDYLGLLTYEAAVALAHWFLSCPDDSTSYPYHPTGIEARLVQVKLVYSYSTEEVGVGEAFNLGDMERNAKWQKRDVEAVSKPSDAIAAS